MKTPLGDFNIVQATYTNGKLVFKAESYDDEGIITLNFKAGKFVGTFEGFGDSGTEDRLLSHLRSCPKCQSQIEDDSLWGRRRGKLTDIRN